MLNWSPLDEDARDGRIVLLRIDHGKGIGVSIEAAYYGLTTKAATAGATKSYPWVILDETNGVNQQKDNDSIVGYVALNKLS